MSQVFIVGGAGQVGRHLSRRLAQGGHRVLALHRKPDQAAALADLGATPVRGDLTGLTVEALAELMAGSEVVVFSAGAGGKGGPELTDAIDGEGFRLALQAAGLAGVPRFLQVSAFPEAGRGRALNERFENYMRIKKATDVELAASDLDWVILRPGTLTDEPGDGRIRAGLAVPYGNISRDNVAATLAALVDQPGVSRRIIELTDGDQSAEEAMQALIRD